MLVVQHFAAEFSCIGHNCSVQSENLPNQPDCFGALRCLTQMQMLCNLISYGDGADRTRHDAYRSHNALIRGRGHCTLATQITNNSTTDDASCCFAVCATVDRFWAAAEARRHRRSKRPRCFAQGARCYDGRPVQVEEHQLHGRGSSAEGAAEAAGHCEVESLVVSSQLQSAVEAQQGAAVAAAAS